MDTNKKIARICFVNAKESEELRGKAQEVFGNSLDGSLFHNVLLHCVEPMSIITPAYIYESDDWWGDFFYMDDFEEFWNKYYTERSF